MFWAELYLALAGLDYADLGICVWHDLGLSMAVVAVVAFLKCVWCAGYFVERESHCEVYLSLRSKLHACTLYNLPVFKCSHYSTVLPTK